MDIRLNPKEVHIKKRDDIVDHYEMEMEYDGIRVQIPNCCFEHHRDGLYVRVMDEGNNATLLTLISTDTSL